MSFRFCILGQILLISLDQILKNLAYRQKFFFVCEILTFDLKKNFGVALGTQFSNQAFVNAGLIFLFSLLILLQFFWTQYLFKSKEFRTLNFLIILMMSGVGGNVLDKLFHGFVIDFINLNFLFFQNLYFNLADIYLVFGSLGVFIFLFFKSSLLYFEANKRVKLIIEKEYQLTTSKFFVSIVWAVSFVCFFITGGTLTYFKVFNKMDVLFFILVAQTILTIALSFGAHYLGVLFSHRTSGALFALKRNLILNPQEKLKLREDDFHQDYLNEIFNLIKNSNEKL